MRSIGVPPRTLLAIGLSVLMVGVTGLSIMVLNPTVAPNAPAPPPPQENEILGRKPTMGWNNWNHFGSDGLTETLIRETADAMVSSGLLAAGYDVVALDDGWSARPRDESGNLTHDRVDFPSGMKALGDYIHDRGLRFGIYASIGRSTCTGEDPGSLDHEFQDVATFASWGVDYIKADRCDASGLVMEDIYARWRDAIIASGRPIVLSASDNNPSDEPWAWGPVTAHQWRMSGDISDDWTDPPDQPSWKDGMIDIFDRNAAHAAATASGTFNDPDMLQVGNGGMTDEEYRTHFGLWALMAAPLIAGNDVRAMRPEIQEILTHDEVIAVDQDPLAFQAIRANDDGAGLQVWYKPLADDGTRAVGLLNRGEVAAEIIVEWNAIGLAPGPATVRDLWNRADRGTFEDRYGVSVPSHGLALLRVVGTDPVVTDGFLSDQRWTFMANEGGPVERDSSVGESGVGDGQSIRLNGVTYAKGLGAHAPSAIEFRPNGRCSTFAADVGIDDEVGDRGSVIFQVWGDGERLFESDVMTGTTPAEPVRVDISDVRSLRLQVIAVDSAVDDHADWADARVTCTAPPNGPPVASFTASPALVDVGESVTFDATGSTDPDGTILAYDWEFDDGSSGHGTVIKHAFPRQGRYTVGLTVTDDGGAQDSAAAEVVVDRPPEARFTVNPPNALPDTPMTFDASASVDPDGTILSYRWHFGDGQTAEGKVRTHSYAERGAFLARLVVTDDLGVQNETAQTLGIADRPPVIVGASPGGHAVVEVSNSRVFSIAATDPDGDGLVYSWTLDGQPVGGVGSTFTFVAKDTGSHRLEVLASDGFASVNHTWTVEVRPDSGPPLPPPGSTTGAPSVVGVAVFATLALAGAATVWILRRRTR